MIKATSIGILVTLLLPNISLANSWIKGYTSPSSSQDTYQRATTSSGGSRTFCQNPLNDRHLTLVVPNEEVVHYTASTNPSLFFHSQSKATTPLIFTLVDAEKIEPLIEKPIDVPNSGYHEIALTPEIQLQPNKVYSWYIAIPCSNDPENFREVLKASIKYIPPSPELKRQLKRAANSQQRLQIYAAESRWYDAIEEANLINSSLQSLQNQSNSDNKSAEHSAFFFQKPFR